MITSERHASDSRRVRGLSVVKDSAGLTPSFRDLREAFSSCHSKSQDLGWLPRRRLNADFFLPSHHYEACVAKCLEDGQCWLDVGGGHTLFPQNENWAKRLSERAGRLVAVDPSENVERNPHIHDYERCLLEDYECDDKFDLITFRMVVEHVPNPTQVANKVATLLRPNGKVVLFTVNLRAVITTISRCVPDRFHLAAKQLFWDCKPGHTFETEYLMNTRKALGKQFGDTGLEEVYFAYLDDCFMFPKFKWLDKAEMLGWSTINRLGMRYPENNLLAVYQKQAIDSFE